MVKPNLTVGSVFEDGGLYYEVQAVLPSGDYISKRIEKSVEEENVQTEIPLPIDEENVNSEVKKEEKTPVKRQRTTSRRNTGGRKKQ
nr:MAG TPA: hypothetical protein [Bacteriophage sp.]